MIVSIIAALPLVVKAAYDVELVPTCGEADSNGIKSCEVAYIIVESKPLEKLDVTVKEIGGAEVMADSFVSSGDWSLQPVAGTDGTWNLTFESPGISGEGSLFTFKFKESLGECGVKVEPVGGKGATVTPGNDNKTEDPENPQTGSTLPYIALGSIALIAAGAYVTTRNKSKVYKI